MYVVITGNGLYGPFNTEDEAISYAKQRFINRHVWHVRPIDPPV